MDELGSDYDSTVQDISERWGEGTERFYAQRGIGGQTGFGKHPCLLIIDMAVAFNDPSYKVGDEMPATLDAIAQLLQAAREKNVLVVYTTTAYQKDFKDAGMFGKKIPALAELQLGSEGVEIHPRIAPAEGEHVITKKFASSFFMTHLPSLLITEGIDTVILTGCSTSGCIRAGAIDSVSYGFHTVVPLEAVSDRAEGPHWANLFDINAKYADVLPLPKVLDYLRSLPESVQERKLAAAAARGS
jgi:nicotinamidase-related amidase